VLEGVRDRRASIRVHRFTLHLEFLALVGPRVQRSLERTSFFDCMH
jgi:hypothetical protein